MREDNLLKPKIVTYRPVNNPGTANFRNLVFDNFKSALNAKQNQTLSKN